MRTYVHRRSKSWNYSSLLLRVAGCDNIARETSRDANDTPCLSVNVNLIESVSSNDRMISALMRIVREHAIKRASASQERFDEFSWNLIVDCVRAQIDLIPRVRQRCLISRDARIRQTEEDSFPVFCPLY